MKELQIFNYQNNPITFKTIDNISYARATEMAKPFGKVTKNWLANKTTTDFLMSLESISRIPLTQLVIVQRGKSKKFDQGTWFHEDVALEFARWLNPEFAIWCNDRIKELLRHGVTTTGNMAEQMLANPDVLINALIALKSEREEKAKLLLQNQRQLNEIKEIAPKAEYYDTVLQSSETYVITRIAQELGISAVVMNKKLSDMRVIRKVNGQWVLYNKYLGNGYTKPKTVTFTKSDGSVGTNTQTVWTEKGRQFIHGLFTHN